MIFDMIEKLLEHKCETTQTSPSDLNVSKNQTHTLDYFLIVPDRQIA